MRRPNETRSGARCPEFKFVDCAPDVRRAAPPSHGTIDYDFYKARARRLRQDCMAQVMWALSLRIVRGLIVLADRIVAIADGRARAPEKAR